MALVLTMRKGHDFFVEGQRVVVSSVRSALDFDVKNPHGQVYSIDEFKWANVLPGVKLRAAIPRDQSGMLVRVSIDAPGKKIVRGNLFRRAVEIEDACSSCNGKGFLAIKVLCPLCKGHGCSGCDNGFIDDTFKCPECGGKK